MVMDILTSCKRWCLKTAKLAHQGYKSFFSSGVEKIKSTCPQYVLSVSAYSAVYYTTGLYSLILFFQF